MIEVTFAMIKPDAVRDGHACEIMERIVDERFKVLRGREANLTEEQVDALYAEHVGKPFWSDLRAFLLSGPVVLLKLQGESAIARWRAMMGATDSRKAAECTIRHAYGDKTGIIFRNCVHGSDSPESVKRELAIWGWA